MDILLVTVASLWPRLTNRSLQLALQLLLGSVSVGVYAAHLEQLCGRPPCISQVRI